MTELRKFPPAKLPPFRRAPRSFPAIALASRRRIGRVGCVPALRIVGTVAALGWLSVCMPTRIEAAPVVTSDTRDPYPIPIAEAAARFNIPAAWLSAVMHVESAGNPRAISPKGAMGLMQIMPDTWTQLRTRYHLGADPFDPRDNIIAGAAYLRELLDRFGTVGFLAAYNAGPKRLEDQLAGLRPLSGETQRYLSRLAQLLPDIGIGDGGTTASPTTNWRVAGLFANAPAASPLPNNEPPNHSDGNTSSAPSFALAPLSSGLFVPVDKTAQR